MDAARFVGGDLYDFFAVDDDHMAFMIGDVSGKGVPAALFMVVTKASIEGHAHPGSSPGEIIGKANANLCRGNDECMFVTSWLGILEMSTGRLQFTNAGHNPPIMIRHGGEPELLSTKPNLVLGAREEAPFSTFETLMHPGDVILLYTDGTTEANDHYREFYGLERLMAKAGESAGMHPMDAIVMIRDDIGEFTKGTEQYDDITLLMVRYDGSDKPLLDGQDIAVTVPAVGETVDGIPDEVDPETSD